MSSDVCAFNAFSLNSVGVDFLASHISSFDMNAIAKNEYPYNTALHGLHPVDVAAIHGFVLVTKELTKNSP